MGDGALDKLREAVQQDLLSQGYSEKAVMHATTPVNTGDLAGYNAFGVAFTDRGGMMTIWLKIEQDVIEAASFTTDKGDAPVACGSMLTEMVKGKPISEASRLTPADLLQALEGLPGEQVHAADLAIEVLGLAIQNYSGC